MRKMGIFIVEKSYAKKPHKLRPQGAIEGLPRQVVPKTGIKPKQGKDLGTKGLPLFEQKKVEEGTKQKNLFEETVNEAL